MIAESISQWTRGIRYVLGKGFTQKTVVKSRRAKDPVGSEKQCQHWMCSDEVIRVYDENVDEPQIITVEEGSEKYTLRCGFPDFWTTGARRPYEAGTFLELYGVNLQHGAYQGPVPGGLLIGPRNVEMDARSYDMFVCAYEIPEDQGDVSPATIGGRGIVGGKMCSAIVKSPGIVSQEDFVAKFGDDASLGVADNVSGVILSGVNVVNQNSHKPAIGIAIGKNVSDLTVTDSIFSTGVGFEPTGPGQRWTFEHSEFRCSVGPYARTSIGRILWGSEIVFRYNEVYDYCQGLMGVNTRPDRIVIHDNTFFGHHRAGSSEAIVFEQRGQNMKPIWPDDKGNPGKANRIAIFRNRFFGSCGPYLTAPMEHVYLMANYHEDQRSAFRIGAVRQKHLKTASQIDHVLIAEMENKNGFVVIDSNRDTDEKESTVRGLSIQGGLWTMPGGIVVNPMIDGRNNSLQTPAIYMSVERTMWGDGYVGNFQPRSSRPRVASPPINSPPIYGFGADMYEGKNFWDDDQSKRLMLVTGESLPL